MDTAAKSKQIDAYTSEMLSKAEKYQIDVQNRTQIASKWIHLAVDRSKADKKRSNIYFKPESVRRVYEFFSFIRIKKGRQYVQFNLSPFQAWILSEIFGWFYTADNTRRYRYALLYTARKSGKTVFMVCMELYMLMYDYEEDPEAYLCATTREQAGQGLRYTKNIVKKSISLRKRLKVQQFQIKYEKRSGILRVLANKPDANDSLNPYVFIIDEMHAHKNLDFYNVMKSGIMERINPLGIITSTAGFNKDYPFFEMLEMAKKVLEGILNDDITFYALYTLDDDDDIEDCTTWEKANPNLGVTISLEALKKEWDKAKLMISTKRNFITKNLNRYLDGEDQWIADEVYVENFKQMPVPSTRVDAFIGIDLAATKDLCAMVIVWKDPETGKLGVIPEFHFPQNEDKRIRAGGIDLVAWIEEGYIIEHPRRTIDENIIIDRIRYWNDFFNIMRIDYDPWNSSTIISKLETDMGIECCKFPQNVKWFNFPLRYLEKIIYQNEILISDSPVLRWMFRNIVLYYDGNGNFKIMKNKSNDSVDGPVALAMAIFGWLSNNNDLFAEFFKELYADKIEEKR